MTVVLALFAALSYGAADFFGGVASRRMPPVAVVVLSQVAGIVVLGGAWLALPGRFYFSDILPGIGAGFGGAVGIAALYAALSKGRMGVVSPISAVVGASVPVVAGLSLGERPPVAAFAGVACAFVAVALVSADAQTRRLSVGEPGLLLALVSGLGIGALYVFLALGHRDAGLGLLATSRFTSLALLTTFALVKRVDLRPAPRSLRTVLYSGTLDMLANVLYVVATRYGLLSIAAVLTSLYPASTVFLARLLLDERLAPAQWVGVGFAVAGVILIAV